MFNRFAKDARYIAAAAQEAARGLGSSTVEAEHLLLALAERPDDPAQRVLLDAGLDRQTVHEALDRENERSLAAVGVEAGAFDLRSSTNAGESPRWAASGKLALERSLEAATTRGDNRIGSCHVLLGVLRAPVGTVPRAFECAGVDVAKVAHRAEASLDACV